MFLLRVRAAVAATVLASGLFACGGSSTLPPSTPNPTPTTQSPCAAAADLSAEAGSVTSGFSRKSAPDTLLDGNPRWRVLDELWTHRAEEARREARPRAPRRGLEAGLPAHAADIGEVAVVQDEGDLVLPPNTIDLANTGLRFMPNGAGGYDVRRIDGSFRATLGSRVTLEDDDSVAAAVPFGFSFYGRTQRSAFVNSDGNITFDEEDKSSSERNIARLLTGPPRVAPFLADLDPTTGVSRVFVNAAADQYTVTWCNVRGFDSALSVSAQATLLPDGTIEFKYEGLNFGNGVVGLSPGRTGDFVPVNLSDEGPTNGGSGALGERFARQAQLDTVALAQKFYSTHPDNYDQLVIWSDQTLITDAFAYEATVANEVRGIGLDTYDVSREFGSAGRMRSLVMMDWLDKYPDDPAQKFLGENNTLSVIGQEAGHRWLVFFEFRDRTAQVSGQLLGRDQAHWSFFFDSDASVMEGNDIEDLGGGSFRTVAAVRRYSLLDQYAMGLVPDTAVPRFFYVESPTNVVPARTNVSAPLVGVTLNGTRRDVLIQDIVAVHGPRVPSPADSAKVHRQAFIYLVSAGRSVDSTLAAKVDRIRRQWEAFFLEATDGRMAAITSLR